MNDRKAEERLLEVCIDNDHITITVERFQELVAAEVKLGVIRDVYYESKYVTEAHDFCRVLFGPKPEAEGDKDA